MLTHTLTVRPGGRREHMTAKELDDFLYRLSLLGPLDATDVRGKVAMRGRILELWATVAEDEAETARQIEAMTAEVTVPPHAPDTDLMPGYPAPDTLALAPGSVRPPPARAQLDGAKHRK